MMVRMMVGKNSIFSCRAVQSLLLLPLSVAGPGGAVSYRPGNRQLGRSSIARPTGVCIIPVSSRGMTGYVSAKAKPARARDTIICVLRPLGGASPSPRGLAGGAPGKEPEPVAKHRAGDKYEMKISQLIICRVVKGWPLILAIFYFIPPFERAASALA